MDPNDNDLPPVSPPPPPAGASSPPPPGGSPPPPGSPPPAGSAGGPVSENRTIMLVLAYLWILALIPLLAEKNDREVQWHAKNGLLLFLAEIVAHLVLQVIAWTGILSCLTCAVLPFIMLIQIVVHVFAIVKALNGERLVIPGLSQYADQF